MDALRSLKEAGNATTLFPRANAGANLGIWIYGVDMGDAGETIEPEESQ